MRINQIEDVAIKYSKEINLKYKEKNFPKRLDQQSIDLTYKLWDIVEEILPGQCDIQLEFYPSYIEHINTYGHNTAQNVHTVFDKFKVSNINIIIHYPEISIRNSKEETHTIKDIFVRISISLHKKNYYNRDNIEYEIHTIEGVRSTVSYKEYISDYAHSHLPRKPWLTMNNGGHLNFNNFCTGEGDIDKTIKIVQEDLNENKSNSTFEDFRLLLLQIQPFLEWESLEGTPYMNIKNIGNPKIKSIDNLVNPAVASDIAEQFRFKSYQNIPKLNWEFRNGEYYIRDDEVFEDFFPQYVTKNTLFYLFKNERGEYFKNDRINITVVNNFKKEWMPFRGIRVPFVVLPPQEDDKAIDLKIYIHPKIKKYVKSRLESEANQAAIRQIAIKAINTSYSPG